MSDWPIALNALHAQAKAAILISVTDSAGSVPRHAGARMLVSATAQFDTIGGGQLEMRAIDMARAMLNEHRDHETCQFALGPSLGQCCGGSVRLEFQRIDPNTAEGQAQRAQLQSAATAEQRAWPTLMLFGAGHVGAALVRQLAHLPCNITWVDARDAQFEPSAAPWLGTLPPHIVIEATDTPETLIANAAPGTCFLVMTHSHTLDQHLCEQVLRRPTPDWLGLIGSRSKRINFTRRLSERGIAPERLAALVCPIGLPDIHGREPAVIALAVAAQLWQHWHAHSSNQSDPRT